MIENEQPKEEEIIKESNETKIKYHVQIYLYDITKGFYSALSKVFLHKELEGVYHSSIVVYNKEYFYSGKIFSSVPGVNNY